VLKIDLDSIESQAGLVAYVNVLLNRHAVVSSFKLRKVIEHWNITPGDGHIYFASAALVRASRKQVTLKYACALILRTCISAYLAGACAWARLLSQRTRSWQFSSSQCSSTACSATSTGGHNFTMPAHNVPTRLHALTVRRACAVRPPWVVQSVTDAHYTLHPEERTYQASVVFRDYVQHHAAGGATTRA
jgi:hypothetical protein